MSAQTLIATKPITGTTEECVKRFAASAGFSEQGRFISRETTHLRDKICDLFGVGKTIGYNWFSAGAVLPIGANLMKLQLFLEIVGYTITERKRLTPLQRSLADGVALGAFLTDEAIQFLGMKNNKPFFCWCRGANEPVASQMPRVEEWVSRHEAAIRDKRQQWQSFVDGLNFGLKKADETPVQASVVQVPKTQMPSLVLPPAAPHNNGSMHRSQTIEALYHLISAALPLAEHVLSDEFSPKEREFLRQKTQDGRTNRLFNLSNCLSRLCSERARDTVGVSPSQRAENTGGKVV